MGLFKKKNQQEEAEEKKEATYDYKKTILESLNAKLKGTLYDDCVILPKGFTIDVQIGRSNFLEDDGIHMLQAIFLLRHDDFDEPLIEPVDAQGKTEEEAAQMAVDMFYGAVWHPMDQAMSKKNPTQISVDFLKQHYDFDMYCQSVVRIGMADKKPTALMEYIKTDIPKYLGSKKYYWIRVFLAKYQDKQVVEVRVNGSVCTELSKRFKIYVDSWEAEEGFVSEKQYAIFVQREDDQCPYKKEVVIDAGKRAIEMMEKISNRDEYIEMAKTLDEEITEKIKENVADEAKATAIAKGLSAEVRIFIPEILAKLTLGYTEGDSLFLLEGEGETQQSIEFKKTQLRSYFYLQQVVLEYFSTSPAQESVQRIVTNSVAFREMRKVIDKMKEDGVLDKMQAEGNEFKPDVLYVPGTSYRIGIDGYKVW